MMPSQSKNHQILGPALEQAIDAVVLIDDSNRINFFNAAAERLWGYSRDEVLGRNVSILVPIHVQPDHDGYIERNRQGHENKIVGTSREVKLTRKNGEEIWAAFSLSKVDVGGRIHYVGFLRDVTELVRDREALHLLSLAVNETDRAMLVLDQDRRITYVNRAFADLFGYSAADAIGKHPTDLIKPEPTHAGLLNRLRHRTWKGERFTAEIAVRNKLGQTVWTSAAVNPILNEQGSVASVVIALSDITSLKLTQSLQDSVLEVLASGQSLHEVADFLCRGVERIAPDIASSILLIDDQKLRTLAGPSLPASYSAAIDGAPIGESVGSCGTAAWRGQPVFVTDIENDRLWASFKDLALEHGLRACWSWPIKLRDGRIAGTFAFYSREPRAPGPFHEQIVQACLHLSKLAIEHDEARQEIARLSSFDSLTGLPNRARMLAETQALLNATVGEQGRIALFFINMDRFKDINGGLGYAIGDKALVEIAHRVRGVFSGSGTIISRATGDCFVVVTPDCNAEDAASKADRLLRILEQPIDFLDGSVNLSASIGISIHGDNGSDAEALLNSAEAAMQKAKQAGRATYRFFSADMNQLAQDRLLLGMALRKALSSNKLKLHYQPQVNLSTTTLHGVEALTRWHDPVFGEISPARFIPLAEEIGLIEAIGRWSLREACRQMAAWRAAGVPVPTVSVNLSPLHIRDATLPTFVADLLDEFNLTADCLTVEITESVMMEATAETRKTLTDLNDLGVGLSMDDFGTGYSSLSSLTQMPISELKLDRSFMRNFETDPSAQAVTTAVVRIGQSLGMTVVSEGVETETQAALLRLLNCTVAQGYYFARAMAPDDLERWIELCQPDSLSRVNIYA
jgi:c-di-GMP-specific phosphodiesterase